MGERSPPGPSGDAAGDAVALPGADGGEPEGLELLRTRPLEALKRLKKGILLGVGGLAWVGANLALGEARWSLVLWGVWSVVMLHDALASGTGVFAPPQEESGAVRTDRLAIRPGIRVLAGLLAAFSLLAALAVLSSAGEGSRDTWIAFFAAVAMAVVMAALAVTGGGYLWEEAPPVPHPDYLAAGTPPSALAAGDPSAAADLPSHEPAPLRRGG